MVTLKIYIRLFCLKLDAKCPLSFLLTDRIMEQ